MAPTRATLHAGNLPVELTSFVGRRHEVADLTRMLPTSRLLTLTGPGGVGKTKLALRAARETARLYPDGTWFVELAAVQDPALVTQAAFAALGLQDRAARPSMSRLTDYLAGKRCLLILDNCEHVLASAALLASGILRAAPDVRILATSRQALGVTGEIVVDVPTLSLPEAARPPLAEALALRRGRAIRRAGAGCRSRFPSRRGQCGRRGKRVREAGRYGSRDRARRGPAPCSRP